MVTIITTVTPHSLSLCGRYRAIRYARFGSLAPQYLPPRHKFGQFPAYVALLPCQGFGELRCGSLAPILEQAQNLPLAGVGARLLRCHRPDPCAGQSDKVQGDGLLFYVAPGYRQCGCAAHPVCDVCKDGIRFSLPVEPSHHQPRYYQRVVLAVVVYKQDAAVIVQGQVLQHVHNGGYVCEIVPISRPRIARQSVDND